MAFETPRGLPTPVQAVSIDAFLEVVQGRRSVRSGFRKDTPVPDELVAKILEAARWAPSAGNSQPWEFIVIRDRDIREKIVELYKSQMRDKIEIEQATRGQRSFVDAGVDFRHAPVHVLVLGDPRTNDAYPMRTKLDKWEAHYYSSLANSVLQMLLAADVLQMLLAAEVLGLSSSYISDVASPYFSVMLKSLLGVPEPLQIYHLLPIGFAKRSPTIVHPRRALEEIAHHERYDRSRSRRGGASGLYGEDVHPGQRVPLLAGDPTSSSHRRTGKGRDYCRRDEDSNPPGSNRPLIRKDGYEPSKFSEIRGRHLRQCHLSGDRGSVCQRSNGELAHVRSDNAG